MKRFGIALALGLGACTTPAERIETALTESGVPPRQARCMGERLQDDLSIGQLQRLSELAKANRGQRLSVARLADQLNEGGDPKLVAQVVGAGISCAF